MKVKVTRVGVTCESSVMDVGAVLELPDVDAERLIAAGYVEAVEVPKAPKAADEPEQPEEAVEVPKAPKAADEPEQPEEAPKKAPRGKK